jgi:hypothetical protein
VVHSLLNIADTYELVDAMTESEAVLSADTHDAEGSQNMHIQTSSPACACIAPPLGPKPA